MRRLHWSKQWMEEAVVMEMLRRGQNADLCFEVKRTGFAGGPDTGVSGEACSQGWPKAFPLLLEGTNGSVFY